MQVTHNRCTSKMCGLGREATLKVLAKLDLTAWEADYLLLKAREEGKANGFPSYEPLDGVIVTVHHRGGQRYTIEIH